MLGQKERSHSVWKIRRISYSVAHGRSEEEEEGLAHSAIEGMIWKDACFSEN